MKAVAFAFIVGILSLMSSGCVWAELLAYDGFEEYAVGQVESGANGSAGTAVDGGFGWGGAYNVSNAIKSLVRIEDRTASPVAYSNGEITIHGGVRALRFYDVANGSSALLRPLGAAFGSDQPLYFSFLFRCNNASPLPNQDFFQVGFDGDAAASGGNPRLSIGVNVISTTIPPDQPFRFFARSTTAIASSAFDDTTDVAAGTTYFLVGRLSGAGGNFDRVDLFVNPFTLALPVTPSATITLDSGIASVSNFYIRSAGLDSGDAYVVDELRVGRDYESVVPEPGSAALAAAGLLMLGALRAVRAG